MENNKFIHEKNIDGAWPVFIFIAGTPDRQDTSTVRHCLTGLTLYLQHSIRYFKYLSSCDLNEFTDGEYDLRR